MTLARTQEQILDRIADVAELDMFGFQRDVLVGALTFENAVGAGLIKPAITARQWDESRDLDLEAAARSYLLFAVGQAVDHRGLSAERSVTKLAEFAWLLGRDDVIKAMNAAPYPQYGAPKLRAFAQGMGFPWPGLENPQDVAALNRMAVGELCGPGGCDWGCGQ